MERKKRMKTTGNMTVKKGKGPNMEENNNHDHFLSSCHVSHSESFIFTMSCNIRKSARHKVGIKIYSFCYCVSVLKTRSGTQ